MGSCCLSTVPMTDAMQMIVSSEIEKRIDDSNSTAARTTGERVLTRSPWVETDIGGLSVTQAARAELSADRSAPVRVCCRRVVQSKNQSPSRIISSAQAGHIVSQRLDFTVIQFGGHVGHGPAVLAPAIAKRR